MKIHTLATRLRERVSALYGLLDEREKQVQLALQSVEKAKDKAEDAQQRVNATQNEFRGALKDQQGTLASKSELGSLEKQITLLASRSEVENVDARVQKLERLAAGGESRMVAFGSASSLVFQILPLVVSAIALAALFLK